MTLKWGSVVSPVTSSVVVSVPHHVSDSGRSVAPAARGTAADRAPGTRVGLCVQCAAAGAAGTSEAMMRSGAIRRIGGMRILACPPGFREGRPRAALVPAPGLLDLLLAL